MNVAIVTTHFGSADATDAERFADRLARGLHARADRVSVLTTCASSPREPWNPQRHEPGEADFEGIVLKRFRTDKRDFSRFRELDRAMHAPPAVQKTLGEQETSDLVATSVNSTPLLSFLARHADEFDAIVYVADFSGVLLRGWRIAQGRAIVALAVEDDRFALLAPARAMMLGARSILFESARSQMRGRDLYGPGVLARSTVIGTCEGVDSLDLARGALETIVVADGRLPVKRGSTQVVHYLARAEYAESRTILALGLSALLNRNGYRSCVAAEERDQRLEFVVEDPLEALRGDAVSIVYRTVTGEAGPVDGTALMVLEGTPPAFLGAGGARIPIPLFIDLEAWNIEPAPEVLSPLDDGRNNLICVADLLPHNHSLELIEIFRHYVLMDFNARLVLVGNERQPAYAAQVRAYVERCGLANRVHFLGTISRPALVAVYRTARAFVSLRDGYETGLSLLESMAFNVPICARDVASAREITVGKTILFSDLRTPIEVAALWRAVTKDGPFRDSAIEIQNDFLASRTSERTLRTIKSALGPSLELARA
jgi:glycosyltransferase involved in cell wall biosynthesis